MYWVELARRARRDLGRIDSTENRDRIEAKLEELAEGVANLDIKPLSGRPPWRRLRVGKWRILFRPVEDDDGELVGYLVARVIPRSELGDAAKKL